MFDNKSFNINRLFKYYSRWYFKHYHVLCIILYITMFM